MIDEQTTTAPSQQLLAAWLQGSGRLSSAASSANHANPAVFLGYWLLAFRCRLLWSLFPDPWSLSFRSLAPSSLLFCSLVPAFLFSCSLVPLLPCCLAPLLPCSLAPLLPCSLGPLVGLSTHPHPSSPHPPAFLFPFPLFPWSFGPCFLPHPPMYSAPHPPMPFCETVKL
jgi:hypothetical protein